MKKLLLVLLLCTHAAYAIRPIDDASKQFQDSLNTFLKNKNSSTAQAVVGEYDNSENTDKYRRTFDSTLTVNKLTIDQLRSLAAAAPMAPAVAGSALPTKSPSGATATPIPPAPPAPPMGTLAGTASGKLKPALTPMQKLGQARGGKATAAATSLLSEAEDNAIEQAVADANALDLAKATVKQLTDAINAIKATIKSGMSKDQKDKAFKAIKRLAEQRQKIKPKAVKPETEVELIGTLFPSSDNEPNTQERMKAMDAEVKAVAVQAKQAMQDAESQLERLDGLVTGKKAEELLKTSRELGAAFSQQANDALTKIKAAMPDLRIGRKGSAEQLEELQQTETEFIKFLEEEDRKVNEKKEADAKQKSQQLEDLKQRHTEMLANIAEAQRVVSNKTRAEQELAARKEAYARQQEQKMSGKEERAQELEKQEDELGRIEGSGRASQQEGAKLREKLTELIPASVTQQTEAVAKKTNELYAKAAQAAKDARQAAKDYVNKAKDLGMVAEEAASKYVNTVKDAGKTVHQAAQKAGSQAKDVTIASLAAAQKAGSDIVAKASALTPAKALGIDMSADFAVAEINFQAKQAEARRAEVEAARALADFMSQKSALEKAALDAGKVKEDPTSSNRFSPQDEKDLEAAFPSFAQAELAPQVAAKDIGDYYEDNYEVAPTPTRSTTTTDLGKHTMIVEEPHHAGFTPEQPEARRTTTTDLGTHTMILDEPITAEGLPEPARPS